MKKSIAITLPIWGLSRTVIQKNKCAGAMDSRRRSAENKTRPRESRAILPEFVFTLDSSRRPRASIYSMKNLAVPLGFLAVGILLMSNPNCRKGCRTVAEHLVNHGLEDFIKGLLAA